MAERRRYTRVRREQPCDVVIQGVRHAAHLADLSLKGALIALAEGVQLVSGADVTLEIPLSADASETIVMTGRVLHRRKQTVAILCSSIDVDSVTHLRRLLELNTGDPALIERELVTPRA